jgi:hypothetical protein
LVDDITADSKVVLAILDMDMRHVYFPSLKT